MMSLKEIRRDQRAEGPAAILGMGTAVPVNCVDQATFPDYYFRITNSEHKTDLKQKFTKICENSMIKKRYMHLTEEFISKNPNIAAYNAPSLDARQEIVVAKVPKLGKEAAEKAINEWGQPKSKITHLVFCTNGGVEMPGADYDLTKLLGLDPSAKRCMIYQQGCYGGGTALRMAKDLAENNAGARVLVVVSESTANTFRGTSETHLENLIGQALFGDGAGAVIVGCDLDIKVEVPLFYLVSAAQSILPDSEGELVVHMREAGMIFHLAKQVPDLISRNIERILKDAFKPLGISDWNSIFWIAHPGGPAILEKMETVLGLNPDKLRSSRAVLRDYGNVWGTSVLIILDEMRKFSAKKGLSSTGEGLDWGVLIGFGPGVTVETVVLHSVPINSE